MQSLSDSQVIDLLGGTGTVAALCGVGASAVSMWRHDGIPAARRWQIAEALKAAGKSVPRGFFERSVPPPRQPKSVAAQ